eukprot:285698-Amphidinium_carterae.1
MLSRFLSKSQLRCEDTDSNIVLIRLDDNVHSTSSSVRITSYKESTHRAAGKYVLYPNAGVEAACLADFEEIGPATEDPYQLLNES